jgi:prefoldin subunit 5
MSDTPISDSTPHNVADLGMQIRRLERELNSAQQRVRLLISERDTAQTYADQKWKLRREFHDLFGTDDVEQGVVVVRKYQDRIKRLEEAGDEMEKYIHDQTNTRFIICAIRWREAKEDKL